jgi:hypothetical protein
MLEGGVMSTSETVAGQSPADPPVVSTELAPELASPTEDLVTVVLGSWIILGAATDGWAHLNTLSGLQEDGFFTPWHALLYSGFTATAGWTVWLAYRRRHRARRWWVDGWPAGYRLGALGMVIFLVAGIADMAWHEVLGIETSIDALLSPSHLLLCVGSVLLLTSPARSWWAAGGGGGLRAGSGAVALALATTSASVFLGYVSMFDNVDAVRPYDGEIDSAGYTAAARGVASYVVTIALLAVPLLMAHRRRATFGLGTALVAWVSLFPAVTHELPRLQTVAALAAIAAAVLADWLLVSLDRWRGRDAPLRLPVAGAVFAGLVSSAHVAAVHLEGDVQWPAELWTGVVVTGVAVGAVLGGLAARPYHPSPAPDRTPGAAVTGSA